MDTNIKKYKNCLTKKCKRVGQARTILTVLLSLHTTLTQKSVTLLFRYSNKRV